MACHYVLSLEPFILHSH